MRAGSVRSLFSSVNKTVIVPGKEAKQDQFCSKVRCYFPLHHLHSPCPSRSQTGAGPTTPGESSSTTTTLSSSPKTLSSSSATSSPPPLCPTCHRAPASMCPRVSSRHSVPSCFPIIPRTQTWNSSYREGGRTCRPRGISTRRGSCYHASSTSDRVSQHTAVRVSIYLPIMYLHS